MSSSTTSTTPRTVAPIPTQCAYDFVAIPEILGRSDAQAEAEIVAARPYPVSSSDRHPRVFDHWGRLHLNRDGLGELDGVSTDEEDRAEIEHCSSGGHANSASDREVILQSADDSSG